MPIPRLRAGPSRAASRSAWTTCGIGYDHDWVMGRVIDSISRSRTAWAALLVLVSGLVLHGQRQVPSATAPALAVTHRAGAFFPGDVVLLTISASAPMTGLGGTAFGRSFMTWASSTPGRWQALVGISLETKPGSYDVAVHAVRSGGEQATGVVKLAVQAKQFETRRLTVEPQFVDPPASEVARITREADRLAGIYAGSSTERLWRGAFQPPVPGKATSSFGRLSVFNGEPRQRHQGADFTAATGTPVRAPNAGQVVLAEDLYFSGNTVILDHGAGLYSVLAHLSRITVQPGGRAARGDLLGESGATGRVTGPHLHWATRLGNVSVDPLSLTSALAGMTEGKGGPSPR